MRKRAERLFLKAMRNTVMAAVMILLLFAGMAYSLWRLMDGNRVLSQVTLVGTVSPVDDRTMVHRSSRDDRGIPAYVTVYDGEILRENLLPQDELTIAFPGVKNGEALSATFMGYVPSTRLPDGRGHTLFVQIHWENAISREFFFKQVSEGTASQMEISFRSKKLWQAAVEKMPL